MVGARTGDGGAVGATDVVAAVEAVDGPHGHAPAERRSVPTRLLREGESMAEMRRWRITYRGEVDTQFNPVDIGPTTVEAETVAEGPALLAFIVDDSAPVFMIRTEYVRKVELVTDSLP
jgi:hypothetical protein